MLSNPVISTRKDRSRFVLLTLATLTMISPFHIAAQSENSTPTPLLPNDKPDLTGTWYNDEMGWINPIIDEDGSIVCIVGCELLVAARARARGEEPPAAAPSSYNDGAPNRPLYKAQYQERVKELDERQVEFDPALRCGNPGLPRIGPPDSISQRTDQVIFMYEDLGGAFFRIIYTDGRDHWDNPETTFLGDSIGYWDGDTLVVEAVNFNDETWLIDDGAFHTRGLKVTERLSRVGDTILYQATAEDPEVLAEPWEMTPRTLVLDANPQMEPLPCVELDMDHIVDGTHHDNAR